MVCRLAGCICVVLLLGCSGPTPSAPTPAAPVAQSPTAPSPSTPVVMPEGTPVATGTSPTPTGAPSPSKDGVTVISPQIVEQHFLTLQDQYPGQTLEVRGEIDNITSADDGRSVIFLKTGKEYSTAACLVDEKEVWSRCAPNQTVTMRGSVGKLDAFTSRVLWKLVQAEENPSPVLTTAAIAKEFTEDDSLANSRYADQQFYLQGEIASIEAEVCHLKTNSSIVIRVALPADAPLSPNPFLKSAAYRVGQPLTVFAKYSTLYHEPGLIVVDGLQITVPFPVPGVRYAAAIPTAQERLAKIAKAMQEKQPTLVATTEQFYTDWTTNKAAAQEKYNNSIIELTGPIESFFSNAERGTDSLTLKLADKYAGLTCQLATLAPWKDHQRGQTVTVRGHFDCSFLPQVEEAILIKSEPAAIPRLKLMVEELLQKAAAAGEFSREMWAGNEFVITGSILKYDPDDILAPLKLDGGPAGEIHVSFSSDDHVKVSGLEKRKPGDKLTVVGEVFNWSPDEKVLEINRVWVLP